MSDAKTKHTTNGIYKSGFDGVKKMPYKIVIWAAIGAIAMVVFLLVSQFVIFPSGFNITPPATPDVVITEPIPVPTIITPWPTPAPVPTPTPTPQKYVTCSDYQLITDKYKTPSAFYIVSGNLTIKMYENEYERLSVGEYINLWELRTSSYIGSVGSWYEQTNKKGIESVKLHPVTEAESGYRDACEIVR